MSYGVDLRKKVFSYIQKTRNYQTTSRIFGISINTIKNWESLYLHNGLLEGTPFRALQHNYR